MSAASMIVLASGDARFVETLMGAADLGSPTHVASGLAEAGEALARNRGAVDLLVCGPDVPPDEAVALADALRRTDPGVDVILVAVEPSAKLLRAAMRAGVSDVLPETAPPSEILEAVDRVLARTSVPGAAAGSRGRVVTVFSPKGGCGKSFVSSNLAVLAAGGDRTSCLVDLDLDSGDLPIMLRLRPRRTIVDAVADLDRLQASEGLRPHLTSWRRGIDLLAAPPEPGLADKVTAADVVRILELLRASHSSIVVDCPSAFTDQVLAAIDTTDELVLVASLDVPAVKAAKLALHTLRLLSFPDEKLRVLLNRSDSKVGIRPADAEKVLGRAIDTFVPSTRDVPVSINRGVPLAAQTPDAPAVAPLAALARSLERTRHDQPSAPRSPGRTEGATT